MNGSGTTMLLDRLNSHSKIYGFKEETRVLPYFMQEVANYGDLSNPGNLERLWTDMCGAFPFWKANGEAAIPLPEDWQSRATTPAEIFDYVLGEFARAAGKNTWCEKSPMYALHLQMLADGFPGSRFIHMIRDGRDCAASFHRRWAYPPNIGIYRWKKTIRAARSAASEIDASRYLEVRFEELTQNPETELEGICRFLNVEYEPQMLFSSRSAARVKGVENKRISRNSGNYRDHLSHSQIEKLEGIAGRLLAELGYDPQNRRGDDDVGATALLVFQFVARLRRFGDIFKRSRMADKPFSLIARRIRTGFKSLRSNRY